MTSAADLPSFVPAPTGGSTMSGALPDAINYHRYIYHRLRAYLGRRVWEIGAGYGQYTGMLLEDGRDVLATDIDETMLSKLSERRAAKPNHLSISPVDLLREESIAACASWRPDSVLCLNVLEHIPQDRQALRWLHQHLPAGCVAVFLTPAHPSLYGFMDSEAGHVCRYTRRSLTGIFAETGWTVAHSFYMNPVGGFGWLVRNRLFPPPSRDLDSPQVNNDIRFFDRYLVPVSRALDPFFARFFGQSVVVIASR